MCTLYIYIHAHVYIYTFYECIFYTYYNIQYDAIISSFFFFTIGVKKQTKNIGGLFLATQIPWGRH